MVKVQKESVLTIKDGDSIVAIVYQNGGGNLRMATVDNANWESYEKILNLVYTSKEGVSDIIKDEDN